MMFSRGASVCSGGAMRSFGFEAERIMAQANPQISRHLKIARYRSAYVDAIIRTCAPRSDMAAYLLAHTNAFYIRRDDTPRKGPDKDKPFIVCEVCVDDAMTKSELNMRQELLKLALAAEEIHFDEFRIITAKGGMRSRHPFLEVAEPDKDKPFIVCEVCVDDAMTKSELNMRQELLKLALAAEEIHFDEFRIITAKGGMRSRHPFLEVAERVSRGTYRAGETLAPSRYGVRETFRSGNRRDKICDLENVKRSLILVFEESADAVLDAVRAADVVAFAPADAVQVLRTSKVAFCLHLYVEGEGARALIMAHAPHILSHARELGLNARSLRVHEPEPAMAGHRAFPRCGTPELYFAASG